MSSGKIFAALLGLSVLGLFSGCAVVNYDSTARPDDGIQMSAPVKYNIVSAETVCLKAFDENGKLPSLELDFLGMALKNQPGSQFGDSWKKEYPKLEEAYGYLNILADDTAELKVSARGTNPIIFDDSTGSVPIRVKTVMVLSPEVFSPSWTVFYAFTVSMAPMKKYNYGALLVAVTDDQGKTIGMKVIGLYRSVWFSGLFPTALFACGDLSADRAFFHDMTGDEKNMQISLVAKAVTDIVSTGNAAAIDPKWSNIRGAIVESLAFGDEDAVIKLLKAAHKDNIGGDELESFLTLMGE